MKFRKKGTAVPVVAIQLNMDLVLGKLLYEKWGGIQEEKKGDWLMKNGDEVYTCDGKVFADTYRAIDGVAGQYVKTALVDATEATTSGYVPTLEGKSAFKVGDFIVTNPGGDTYPVHREEFLRIYERAE